MQAMGHVGDRNTRTMSMSALEVDGRISEPLGWVLLSFQSVESNTHTSHNTPVGHLVQRT